MKASAMVLLLFLAGCETMPDAAAVNRFFADPNFQQGSQRLIDATRPRPTFTCYHVGNITQCQ